MTIAPMHPDAVLPTLGLPAGRWHGRIWVTDTPVQDSRCYSECVSVYPSSQLWPVLLPPDARFAVIGQDWLDDRGFEPPTTTQIAGYDPAAVLAQCWQSDCCSIRCLAPFARGFPGLARHSSRRCDPRAEAADTGSLLASARDYRLGLVRAEHPADVPAALGWTGASHRMRQVAALSAVLRSWEDRFGAVLIGLGFDSIEMSVAAPPTTENRALRIAAEHRAFCIDNFRDQPGSLREFALGLITASTWRFWWH